MSYSRDGRELISSEDDGTLRVWNRTTGAQVYAVQIGESFLFEPALSADGRTLVAGVDASIVLLEYPSLKSIRRFSRSADYGHTIAISANGQMIASCHESNDVSLSSPDGATLGKLHHAANVQTIDFSPDGTILVARDMNHEVHLWDVQRQERRVTLRGHTHWVEMVRFSPDGKTIASTSDDGTIRFWRSEPPS